MAKLTQGTRIYFIDPYDGSVVTVACATSFTGLNAPRDQIETTCMEDLVRTFLPGMATPGQASLGINFDPADSSHVRIYQLKNETDNFWWALGWSDGTAAPTTDSDGWVLPATRSWITWQGYIADVPVDFPLNAVAASTVALQVSGEADLTPKTA